MVAGSSRAEVNDVYISQGGGGNGSSCSSPLAASYFNTSSNWTSGTPSGTKIGSGTTVHVCGTITGGTNATILSFQGNGVSGNPITLHFESGAGLSAPYCSWTGNSAGCLVMSSLNHPHSYLVVDGGTPCGWTLASGSEGTCNGTIVNTASGTGMDTGTSTNGIEATACTNCEIKNMGIYNMYVQSGGDTSANPQDENCITFSGQNLLIHDNLMHDVGWCLWYVEANGDNNIQVYNNEVYNTPHPVNFSAGSSGTATNAYFYGNHFHDYENWNTSSCTYHVEGIHTDGSGATFNGLYFYNNMLGPGSGTCLFSDVYLSPNTGTAGSPAMVNQSSVFNNIIVVDGPGGEYGITVGGGNGNAVYNNTIVNLNTSTGSTEASGAALNWSNITQNSSYTFSFKNNASQGFFMMLTNDSTGSEGSGITGDYNVYSDCPSYGSAEGNCLQAFVPGGADSKWSTYMGNKYDQEQHSTNTGLLQGTYCCSGSLGLASNYSPASGSLVIAKATNLNSICSGQPNPGLGALCYDILGNQRPTSGAWDAGAFVSGSSGSAPAPPQALTAVAH